MSPPLKVLYLHGLGSGGQSNTSKGLQAEGLTVVSPDYQPECYEQSLQQLRALLDSESVDGICGTSMGGYYALKIREYFDLPVVAVNPCFEPDALLRYYLDKPAWDYVRDKPITFTADMLSEFEPLAAQLGAAPRIVVGLKDDVIPSDYQREYCQKMAWQWEEKGWGHRVEDAKWLAEYIKRS